MQRSLVMSLGARRVRPAASILLAAFILAGAAGCATTELVNMWRDTTYRQRMGNVLVLAMHRDAARRRLWEDGFASQLERHGVRATPSYRLFPAAIPDTQQVVGAVRENDFDGVIVTRKLGEATRTRSVPGYTTVEPVTVFNPWYGAYVTYYSEVYQPGYTETEETVDYETNVWTTREGGRMVWAGTSRTVDPSSSQEINEEITKLIVPELAKQDIIPER